VREENNMHAKHSTTIDPAKVIDVMPVPAPNALTIKDGTATIPTKSSVIGTALGRAKFTVQPIHLKRLGTIARGSALQ
jgi:hypothetical protein